MKRKNRTTACVLAAIPLMAFALVQDDGLPLYRLKVERRNDSLQVSFTLKVSDVPVGSNDWLMLTPRIEAGDSVAALPPLLIEGRNSRIFHQRNGAPGKQAGAPVRRAKDKGEMTYTGQIAYSEWMRGSSLRMERILAGCCNEQTLEPVLLAENLVNPKRQPQATPPPPPHQASAKEMSVGDSLAQVHPFVNSMSHYHAIRKEAAEGHQSGIFTSPQGAITFYFEVGSAVLKTDFGQNATNLELLNRVLKQITQSTENEVAKVIIGGCVSPEGRKEQNEQLAQERAASMLRYLVATTGLEASVFELQTDLTGWQSLRFLVAQSSMEHRQEVLDVIDHAPVWSNNRQTGRLSTLQQLRGGRPYAHLKEHFFPVLRNAGMVKVYYK